MDIELFCSGTSETSESVVGEFFPYRVPDVYVPSGFRRMSLRHRDDDDTAPSTLESFVYVNHYGDVIIPASRLVGEYYEVLDWNFL